MQWWADCVVSWTLITITHSPLYCFFHVQLFNYSGLHVLGDNEANPLTLHIRLRLFFCHFRSVADRHEQVGNQGGSQGHFDWTCV